MNRAAGLPAEQASIAQRCRSRKMALGDKSGVSEKRFYKRLVKVADERYDVHLTRVKPQKKR
jgi:hypothetical protein